MRSLEQFFETFMNTTLTEESVLRIDTANNRELRDPGELIVSCCFSLVSGPVKSADRHLHPDQSCFPLLAI